MSHRQQSWKWNDYCKMGINIQGRQDVCVSQVQTSHLYISPSRRHQVSQVRPQALSQVPSQVLSQAISTITSLPGTQESTKNSINLCLKMWTTLDEADQASFHIAVRGIDNQNTGISVWVVPSMMTIQDLKRQYCNKVMFWFLTSVKVNINIIS